MREITLMLRFVQPCLGARPAVRPDGVRVLGMSRGTSGQVLFSPVWWRVIVCHGAKVKGGSVSLAKKIAWSAEVDGVTNRWIRHLPKGPDGRAGHVHHEAFLPGDVIGVDCVLPRGLDPKLFRRWMEAGGKYLGVSPYKPGEYGRFEVVDLVDHSVGVHPERDRT